MTSVIKLRGEAALNEHNAYHNMERTMTDVCGAGSCETTATMVSFSVLYMAKLPHVLERVRKEFDAAWTDDDDLQYLLASMPYARATILELLRHVTVLRN